MKAGAAGGFRIARFDLVAAERARESRERFSRADTAASGSIPFGPAP